MTQRADASRDSLVIQSGENTNIGYSAEEMRAVIETLADQVPKYAAIASEIVEARLKAFEERILSRFATEQANPTAFADPDFQHALGTAQRSFCRFGDEVSADILVALLAQKSKEPARNRLSLVLGQAVEKAALLTANELAALSLAHLLVSVKFIVPNFGALCSRLQDQAVPLLSDITTEESSYTYLESQGCASVIFTTGIDLTEVLRRSYPGLLSLGHTSERMVELFGDGFEARCGTLIRPCIHDDGKWQANALDKDTLSRMVDENGLTEFQSQFSVLLEPASLMDKNRMIEAMKPRVPEVEKLFEVWDTTLVRRLRPTPIGTAIAHANLVRISNFKAELTTWIK